jgi:hypothetical protein
VNLGLDYLPGAAMFDPLADPMTPELASAVVWFDALVSNVDRTVRNTNMLMWHRALWLIDHGAALFFHHATNDYTRRAHDPFARISDHVLLPLATRLADVDAHLATRLDRSALERIASLVPDDWLEGDTRFASAAQRRDAYVAYLDARLASPRAFVTEAQRAQALHV